MKTVEPRYVGDRAVDPNYGPGWIGFSYRDNNVISKGIAFFTREEYEGIVPSHAFIVRDKQTIIEATWPEVKITDISHYFDDPHVVVFFKKPVDLTPKDISDLVFNATFHIGRKYDTTVFGYFVFRYILRLLGKLEPYKDKPAWGDTPEKWVCSELVAYCLKAIDKYANLFPLSEYHPSKVDPLMLFRSEIFKEWSFNA